MNPINTQLSVPVGEIRVGLSHQESGGVFPGGISLAEVAESCKKGFVPPLGQPQTRLQPHNPQLATSSVKFHVEGLRPETGLVYAGLVVLSFDITQNEARALMTAVVQEDPFVVMAVRHNNAQNVSLIIRVDSVAEEHQRAVRKVGAYFVLKYGLLPSRLFESPGLIVSDFNDPGSYFNPKAKTFQVTSLALHSSPNSTMETTPPKKEETKVVPEPKAKQVSKMNPFALLAGIKQYRIQRERMESLLSQIESAEPVLDISDLNMFRVVMGLIQTFGKSGRSLYHRICRLTYGHSEDQANIQYDACLRIKNHSQREEALFEFLEGIVRQLPEKPDEMPVEKEDVPVPEKESPQIEKEDCGEDEAVSQPDQVVEKKKQRMEEPEINRKPVAQKQACLSGIRSSLFSPLVYDQQVGIPARPLHIKVPPGLKIRPSQVAHGYKHVQEVRKDFCATPDAGERLNRVHCSFESIETKCLLVRARAKKGREPERGPPVPTY